jgi:putative monooxygenase
MTEKRVGVFKVTDVPFLESLDATMRDSVMVIEDTCGSQQYTAGLFWCRPRSRAHDDTHDVEEVFYIIQGRGHFLMDEKPVPIEAGDVVFVPDGVKHELVNEGDETLILFWAIAAKWSDLPSIQTGLGAWREIEPGTDWGPLP